MTVREKSKLQAEHDEKRHQYVMENKISHQEFYDWLGEQIHVNESDLPFTLEQIRNSHDQHLNDLPLVKWDRCDPIVRGKAVRAGMQSWSLSDTVCVLKCYARRVAGL